MNEEVIVIPRHYLRDAIKVVRKGLEAENIDDEFREQMEMWCDTMDGEIDEELNFFD